VVPVGRDHWWSLTVQDPPERVASEVVEAVLTYGLPAVRAEIERTG